jgi:branched-chain amino acid transport system substrate-binding protein
MRESVRGTAAANAGGSADPGAPRPGRVHGRWRAASASVLGAVALVVGGCGSSGTKAASDVASTSPIVLGVTGTLTTGPLAPVTVPYVNTLQAAANYQNAHGGVNGRKIEIHRLDDAGSQTQAISNATSLVDSGVTAVLAVTTTATCDVVAPIAERHSTPILCTFVSPDSLNPPKQFLFSGLDPEVNSVAAEVALTSRLIKVANPRIAIVGQSLGGPQAWESASKQAAASRGWKVVSSVETDQSTVGLTALATTVASSRPDVVWYDPSSAALRSMTADLRSSGVNVPLIANAAVAGYAQVSAMQDSNLYQLSPVEFVTPSSTGSGVATYEQYEKTLGLTSVPELNGAIADADGWLQVLDVASALQNCGACRGSQLASALEKAYVDVAGLGSYGYTANRHTPFSSYFLYRWTGNGIQLVESGLSTGSHV